MAELFDVNIPAISKHLNNIYSEEELSEETIISKMEIVQTEGKRQVKRKVYFYNLDAIIAVGYRENSKKATRAYQKIADVFEQCSYDYDKNSDTTKAFYAFVQNRMHQ